MDHYQQIPTTSGHSRASVTAMSPRTQRACVDAMALMRSVGDVGAVEDWLTDENVRAAGAADVTCREKIERCREWLSEAKVYEDKHGRGSMLDRSHPFWINTIEPGIRRVREILRQRYVSAEV